MRKTGWLLLGGVALVGQLAFAEIELVAPGGLVVGGQRAPTIAVPPPVGSEARSGSAPESDVLLFRNGDTLHGSLLAIVPDATVRWSSPDAKRELEFSPANIVQIKLAGKGAAAAEPQAVVTLTNGDELRGKIVSLDSTKLTLQTLYAGELAIQRTMLQTIQPQVGVTTALYVGPTDLDDWRQPQGNQAWTFKNGGFYTSAGTSGIIGRDMKLKDRSRIDFDLAWRNYPYLQISLYADNPENFYGNAYMVQLSGNSVQLQRGRARGGFNNLGGNTTLDNLAQRGKAHFTILVDKSKHTVAFLVDGVLAKQWTDPGDFAGTGTCLMFMSQGQGPMRLSNLIVAEWNGEMGDDNTLTAKTEDMIRFSNNDKVSGQLKSISNGKITFTTAFATLDVPVERAAQIEFASEKTERARRQAGDIRAFFREGGTVTVALEKLDDQTIVGSSENFGKRTFARAAFRELRLHIYDDTAQPAKEDEW